MRLLGNEMAAAATYTQPEVDLVNLLDIGFGEECVAQFERGLERFVVVLRVEDWLV